MAIAPNSKPKLVLDTNVLISALIFGGLPLKVLTLVIRDRASLFVSPAILNELNEVLVVSFNWSQKRAAEVCILVRELAQSVSPQKKVKLVKQDESDNRVLECALACGADYLVTGDHKHLIPLKRVGLVEIVTPARLLEVLDEIGR